MNRKKIRTFLFSCAVLAAFGVAAQSTQGGARQGVKQDAKEVGQATKRVARKIGHGARETGTGIGHGAKKAGIAIGHGAKEGWEATKDATRRVFDQGN